jgi:hypothetical protein
MSATRRSPFAPPAAALAASRRLATQLPRRTHYLSDTEPVERVARLALKSFRSELLRRGAISVVEPSGRVTYR